MKTIIPIITAGVALASSAEAGTPALLTAPPPSVDLWTWFAGGSVGYLTEMGRPMYGLHLGAEYKDSGTSATHAIYLQAGYAEDDAAYRYYPGVPGGPPVGGGITEVSALDMSVIPITINYKFEVSLSGRLNFYSGLGLGVAVVDTSIDWSWSQALPPPLGFGSGRDDHTDVRFYGEVFAGVSYNFSEVFQIYGGARYIFMDDLNPNLHVTGASYDAGIDGTCLIELGIRRRF